MTIVCPIAGDGRFLEATVASVLAQSTPSWELVLVDNGVSCDLQRFAALDPRIRVIAEARRGVAVARNAGLRTVTTPAFAFLDSDDIWTPEKLELQASFLESHPEHGAVYGRFDLIDDDGQAIGPGWAPAAITFRELCRANGLIAGSNIMVRSSLLATTGLMNERLRVADDIDFLFRVACAAPIGSVDQVVTLYRRHPGNISRDYMQVYRETSAIVRRYSGERAGRSDAQCAADRRAGVRRLRRTYGAQAFDAWRKSPRRASPDALTHLLRSARLDLPFVATATASKFWSA